MSDYRPTGERNAEAIAAEVLVALDEGRQVAPFSERSSGFDKEVAYAVAAAVRSMRRARGERTVGRKIGLTNCAARAENDVFVPIWGDMFNTTVRSLANGNAAFEVVELSESMEPRLEAEIAFGLARAPEPGMDEAALLSCVDWVAQGFEIVQSLFPGWRFAAADAIAAFALHGAFLLGPRRSIHGEGISDWLQAMASLGITLERDGIIVDYGHEVNLLGNPVEALSRLVELLAADPASPPLAAGEIVTTGSLTRAFRIVRGENWRTALSGIPIEGIAVRFA